MAEKLIEIKNLKVSFYNSNKIVQVIRGFEMKLDKGKIVGILGESGSGKTVSSSTILRLMEKNEGRVDCGEILFKGRDILKLKEKELNRIRGKEISFVFQNPAQALNPYKRVGKQLQNVLKIHKLETSYDLIINVLSEVGIKDPQTVYNMYPFQLSGGQNQRIMVAQCIICKPDLLIADEPTSSIDASLRKRVLDLLISVNKKYNMSIMVITHDFDVAKYICDSLIIMYGGLVVEVGSIKDILEKPLHPYTEELIKCAHSLDNREDVLYSLEGTPPNPIEFRDECPFYDRCRIKKDECRVKIPDMKYLDNRQVRCIKEVSEIGINND